MEHALVCLCKFVSDQLMNLCLCLNGNLDTKPSVSTLQRPEPILEASHSDLCQSGGLQ